MKNISPCSAEPGLAIVSGASSGIGQEVARLLHRRGHAVLAIARDPARLHLAAEGLNDPVRRHIPTPVDVREASALETACSGAISRHGPPDWVVACAGVARPGRFLDLPPEDHEDSWRTNYLGALNLARACLPAMTRAGRGRLVLVSSAAALGTFHGLSAYSPSKAALRSLGDILSLEMEPHGVSVTTVFPPDTDTPQLKEDLARRPPVLRAYLRGAPVMEASTVAKALLKGAEAGRRHVAPGRGPGLMLRLPVLTDWIGRSRQSRLRHLDEEARR